jgi:hypothetical protein
MQVGRHPWVRSRPSLATHRYRWAIYRDVHLLSWYLWCQQYYPRLGRHRVLSDSGEEGCHYRYDDFVLECFIHLHSLSLPKD